MVYAVVRAGGRQEKVEVGTIVTMDRIKADKDGNVQLTPVLLVDGDKITSDAKSLAKVTVTAEVLGDLRGPKIVIQKFKNKTGYKKRHPKNDVNQPRIHTGLNMLAIAIQRAKSTDPDKVAAALEGMEWTTLSGDHVVMRKDDHQLQMPIYISVHTNKDIKFDLDNSGFGLSLENKIERDQATLPTSCKMRRPS